MRLPFDRVEDLVANIATIFQGFTLTEMYAMTTTEIVEWHERARVRSEA